MVMPHPVTRLSIQQVPARSGYVRLVLGMLLWLAWSLRRRSLLLRLRDEAAQARTQARTDPLTGLGNRAGLQEILTAHLGRVTMLGIIDLDDFKPVNDQYGHHAGDHVLQVVASRLRAAMSTGGSGSAYRLGGDEFAIIWHAGLPAGAGRSPGPVDMRVGSGAGIGAVPGTPGPMTASLLASSPEVIGAQVLACVVDIPIHLAGQELPVGASLGLAVNDGYLSGADLLRMADAAMYEAKQRTHQQPVRRNRGEADTGRWIVRESDAAPSVGRPSSGRQDRTREAASVRGILTALDSVSGMRGEGPAAGPGQRGRQVPGRDRGEPAAHIDRGPGRAGLNGAAPTGAQRVRTSRVIVHPTLTERRYGTRGQSGGGQ